MKYVMVKILVVLSILSASAQDWAEMQKKTIRFYRYQRAGLKSTQCANPYYEGIASNWPHQNDSFNGKELSGGWYDAGDFVKFGLPFSSTVYILLKGYDVFPNCYSDNDSWNKFDSKDSIPDILNEVKYATDFIIKAVINNSTVVYDVGDGDADHKCSVHSCGGPTNASSVGNRPVRLADGADVPGLYAASLALMSNLYRAYDSVYANTCLSKAKEAYHAGWSKRSKGVSTQYGDFYNSKKTPSGFTWQDKMMAGAVELYRVTEDKNYIDDIKTLGANNSVMYNHIGYTNVAPIVAFELWRQGISSDASALLSHVSFLESKVINNQSNAMMNGIYYNQHWGMTGGVAGAAFAAALAYIVEPLEKYKTFAQKHMLWLSGHGVSTKSWIVGYNNGPSVVHHRNAIWKSKLPEGALVSGPDAKGNYKNSVDEYEYTEVAIDYNAAVPGAIAFFRDLSSTTSVKITKALTPSTFTIDFTTTASVSFTATFDKSVTWKLVLTGSKSGATKTFSGTGSSASVNWAGDADAGSFVTYDAITAQLEMENIAIYHLTRARTFTEIKNIKVAPFKAIDVLVDDFEDGDFINKQGGSWVLFSDKNFGGNSSTYPPTLPSTNTAQGETGVGNKVIFYLGAKIEHPFAGIRTAFKSDGSAVSLGNAKSIVFDYMGTSATVNKTFYVEIEQQDIPDSAYYGYRVTVPNALWNRIRIPLNASALKVPSWKSPSVPFSLNRVKTIRFVNYDNDGANITIDNVYVEDLTIVDPANHAQREYTNRKTYIIQRPNSLSFPVALFRGKSCSIHVCTVDGTRLLSLHVQAKPTTGWINVPLNDLSNGLYLIRIISDRNTVSTFPFIFTH